MISIPGMKQFRESARAPSQSLRLPEIHSPRRCVASPPSSWAGIKRRNAQALPTQSLSQTLFGAHDVVIGGNDEVPNVHHPDQGLILRQTKLVRSKVHWIRAA